MCAGERCGWGGRRLGRLSRHQPTEVNSCRCMITIMLISVNSDELCESNAHGF